MRALAITVSDRAAAGAATDESGPLLVQLLSAAGCAVDGPLVIADGEPVEQELRAAIASGYDVVITTGGTGIAPRDQTPEMTARVLERQLPGIAEALRAAGRTVVPTAMLGRGLAGTAGHTLVVNLPGSVGAVRDSMTVLAPVLRHAVDQLSGGDHVRPSTPPPVPPASPNIGDAS